ncbi:MAG: hypothetical protein NT001_06770 [Candidatus Woesearchaeota archaeon]|nr:hypothetical protein [Candidatus Woesearchaeota archaeon]
MKDHTLEREMEKLGEIKKSIEYFEWQRQRALEGIERIENMASNGEIGIDEYDALMRSHTGGMSLEKLKQHYDHLVIKHRVMENELSEKIEMITNAEREKEYAHQNLALRNQENKSKEASEPRTNFLFIAFIMIVSVSLLASSYLKGNLTGFAIWSPDGNVSPSDFFMDSIVVTVIFILIPLMIVFMLKIVKIFKNKP